MTPQRFPSKPLRADTGAGGTEAGLQREDRAGYGAHACACRSPERALERKARRARGPQTRLVRTPNGYSSLACPVGSIRRFPTSWRRRLASPRSHARGLAALSSNPHGAAPADVNTSMPSDPASPRLLRQITGTTRFHGSNTPFSTGPSLYPPFVSIRPNTVVRGGPPARLLKNTCPSSVGTISFQSRSN